MSVWGWQVVLQAKTISWCQQYTGSEDLRVTRVRLFNYLPFTYWSNSLLPLQYTKPTLISGPIILVTAISLIHPVSNCWWCIWVFVCESITGLQSMPCLLSIAPVRTVGHSSNSKGPFYLSWPYCVTHVIYIPFITGTSPLGTTLQTPLQRHSDIAHDKLITHFLTNYNVWIAISFQLPSNMCVLQVLNLFQFKFC